MADALYPLEINAAGARKLAKLIGAGEPAIESLYSEPDRKAVGPRAACRRRIKINVYGSPSGGSFTLTFRKLEDEDTPDENFTEADVTFEIPSNNNEVKAAIVEALGIGDNELEVISGGSGLPDQPVFLIFDRSLARKILVFTKSDPPNDGNDLEGGYYPYHYVETCCA